MMFYALIATLSIFHFSTPTHEEGIDLRATGSVRRKRSLQCQRSLIVAGNGATPSRHLLNYPRLRYLCCMLLLVGPYPAPVEHYKSSSFFRSSFTMKLSSLWCFS